MLIRLRNYINRSFARRFLFFFVPYVVLLLVSMALLSFSSFFTTLKEEKENSTRTLVAQIGSNFDYYYRDIKTVMAYVSINKDIQQVLTQAQPLSVAEQYFLNNRIADSLSNVNIFKSFINDIIIIGKNGYKYNLPNYYPLNQSFDFYQSEWLKTYRPSENSNFGFTSPHKADYYEFNTPIRQVVSALLPITVDGRAVGFIQGDIDYERLSALLDMAYRQNELEITVVTPEGTIVYDRSPDKVNSPLDGEILKHLGGTQGTFINRQRDDSSLIVFQQSDVTGWYLIASIPYAALLSPGYVVSRTILFVILPVSLLVALALFLFIWNQFRQPWNKLVHRMETVTVANYEPARIDYGVGEIAELGNKFEAMLAQNNLLVQQVFLAEIKKKNAELNILREQITPHFLYNSLQVIKAEAIFSKNREISQIVTAFADLLRYSMDNRTAVVTMADEINYIRNYLDIYQRRFIGQFEYQIDVSADLMDYRMQKMILQPLMENCLKHGFEGKKSGGCIQIRARRDGDGCIIQVRDNGKGMSVEKLEQIRKQLDRADQHMLDGIGLFNVHQRIQIECGAAYGIREIDSREGEYTQVTLRI